MTTASTIVKAYLNAMEQRDLQRASGYLAEDFSMIFPGGVEFRSPEQLIEWSKARYRSVRKSYSGYDEVPGQDGTIVYCYGELAGEWPDGSAFSGIRFIDRFEVSNGKITGQQVWNDLAEHRKA